MTKNVLEYIWLTILAAAFGWFIWPISAYLLLVATAMCATAWAITTVLNNV